jgi:hypothetical protein
MPSKKQDTIAAPVSEMIMIRFLLYLSANDPASGERIIRGRPSAIPVTTKIFIFALTFALTIRPDNSP